MLDDERNMYAWKPCKLMNAEIVVISSRELSDADEQAICQLCMPQRSYIGDNVP